MTRIVEQIQTALDREAAFAYVADFSWQAEWDPNTVSSRRIDAGPLGVGARFALEVKVSGRTAPMEYQITEYEAPARIVLIGEGSGVWSRDEITFAVIPGGTQVDYVADIKLSGLLGLVQPLLSTTFRKIGRGAVEGMRVALEARARGSRPASTDGAV